MNKDIKLALLNNLLLKTKIVIILFSAILLIQVIAISYLGVNNLINQVPILYLFVIPVFILFGLSCEYTFRKYILKCIAGEKEYRTSWNYIIVLIEVSFPTIILYYGTLVSIEFIPEISNFGFLNSPPLFVYFIFIILTSLYFDFKLSVFGGIVAMAQYVAISYILLDGTDLGLNLSKALVLGASGIVAGIVSKRLRDSVQSSLEAKNTLIHKLDEKVAERTVKIEQQKIDLANQNLILNERNTEITDSINYAKRLQEAILPSFDEVDLYLKENFIYFKPKDVVSGDFYWFEYKNNCSYFAAADCTGHGVPGALVSVVCSNALDRSLNEFNIKEPSKILDKTRELVIETFAKSGSGRMDGMDIALCVFSEGKVVYSGAYNPLWVLRQTSLLTDVQKEEKNTIVKDEISLIEFKPDKQPIGKYEGMKPFSETEIITHKGDVFYFFSDGFPDQFGGEKGKKFKYKPFKHLLLDNYTKPMEDQHHLLDETFENWRGNLEQVDDVCVIGVKI